MRANCLRALVAGFAALALSGCIDSTSPILAGAEPVFGPRLKLQLYALSKGYAREPEQVTFQWNGGLYAHAGGGLRDVSAFSVHPFEAGDYIIQTVPAKRAGATEYALLHKVVDGVYQVLPIDEDDADEATRSAFCRKQGNTACNIETREQLFAFARATAARQKMDGGLVIRLPDGSERERPQRPARTPRR